MKKASEYLLVAILAFVMGSLQYALYQCYEYIEYYCMPQGAADARCLWYYW